MKKCFGTYSIIWTICLAIFNCIVFLTPNELDGFYKFGGAFWVGYIFISIAFIGHLICAFFAFNSKTKQKLFYKLPLFSISYCGLIITLLVGGFCIVIPDLPNWVGILVCGIFLAFNIICIIKATASAVIVSGIDEKISFQTFFIKNLSLEAENLMRFTKVDELHNEAKKVYEEIRYSDPMANPALSELEAQIEKQFTAFADAIKTEDVDLAKETANALVELVDRRNRKCKLIS